MQRPHLRSHLVEGVRTPAGGIGSRIAGADGELRGAHEVAPLLELDPLTLLTLDVARKDKAARGVAGASGSMGVELTALIMVCNVHRREVAKASDLEEVGRLDKVCTLERSVGNQPRAVARLRAVGYHEFLLGSDSPLRLSDFSSSSSVKYVRGCSGRWTPKWHSPFLCRVPTDKNQ